MATIKYALFFVLTVTLITASSSQIPSADDSNIINPNWVKPGWRSNRHSEIPPEECQCPPVVECTKRTNTEDENNRVAMIFYRKFIITLFDESKLVEDESETNFKLRNVQYKVTDYQLNKLKNARTALEIDSVLSRIVEQSENSVYQTVAETLCWNFVAWYGSATQSSFFLYVIVPAVSLIVLLTIGRLLGIPLWIAIPAIGILITYVLTYRDCNNKLELESLTKLLVTDGSNPCNKHQKSGWFYRLFQKDNKAECIEHLREQYGLRRSFCDPSEVFIEMVAKLHLQYFETFVTKMVSIFKVSTASSSFLETVLISGFILFLIYLVMTVGIKYGLYAGGRFLSDVITGRRNVDQAAHPESILQRSQSLPAVPINLSININRPRSKKSEMDRITNRIEEITEGGSDSKMAGALKTLPAGRSSQPTDEGSGDGDQVRKEDTDGDESSDQETIMVQSNLAHGSTELVIPDMGDNQSKKVQ